MKLAGTRVPKKLKQSAQQSPRIFQPFRVCLNTLSFQDVNNTEACGCRHFVLRVPLSDIVGCTLRYYQRTGKRSGAMRTRRGEVAGVLELPRPPASGLMLMNALHPGSKRFITSLAFFLPGLQLQDAGRGETQPSRQLAL